MKYGFVIHHNGPPANCLGQPHTRCVRFWNAVRNYHINDKGWVDIAYSFGVCPHGIRFEGRGWNKNQFANGKDVVGADDGADIHWYTVLAFIGTGEAPTADMVEGVKAVIHEGRTWARCRDRVLPHNAFKVKPCPGPEFTAYAKAWDNQPFTNKEDPVASGPMPSFVKPAADKGIVGNAVSDWAAPPSKAEVAIMLSRACDWIVKTVPAGSGSGASAAAVANELAKRLAS